MDDVSLLPCALCLRLIDERGLVEVALPHDQIRAGALVNLCGDCCAAVLETCVRRHEEAEPSATIEGAASDEHPHDSHTDQEAKDDA